MKQTFAFLSLVIITGYNIHCTRSETQEKGQKAFLLDFSLSFVYSSKTMAITKSAKRAIRGSQKKKVYNDRRKKTMKEVVKEVKTLVLAKDKKTAQEALSKAYKAIDKAAKTNLIKKNTAARKKSRLSKMIKKLA